MAKSVLELAVGTGQWDAGLKKAKSALDNFTQANGGLQQALDKESQKMQKFVQMMGGMESTAKTAKGQMNDYKSTIEQLTMQYNRMSEAQKKVVGQDYLQAIDQMKQKYQSVNEEIQEMNRSLKNIETPEMKGGGLFGGNGLTGALAVAGGNLIASGVTKLAGEMKDTIQQSVELAKAGEGVRLAFERLNQPGLLDKLKESTHGTVSELELMKAAIKFENFKLPLEDLGTYLAFAQQKAQDTGDSVDNMVTSIVNGLGRQSVQILDNLGISASEIRDRMKEGGDMTQVVAQIIREEMTKAGDYVETTATRAARAAADASNKMEDLGRKAMPMAESWTEAWNSIKTGGMELLTTVLNPLAESINYINSLLASTPEDVFTRNWKGGQVGSNVDDNGNYIKRPAQKGAAGFDWESGTWKPGYSGAIYNAATGQTELPEIVAVGKSIQKSSGKGGKGGKSGSTGPSMPKNVRWDNYIDKVNLGAEELKGSDIKETMSVWATMSDEAKKSMFGLTVATEDLGDAQAKMWDKWIKSDIQSKLEQQNKLLQEQQTRYTLAGQAASNFGAALAGLDDPAAKAAGTVMQAIASIAMGFAMASSNANTAGTGWGWLAWLAAGTAAMATTIGTIHSLTGYAQGGIVKGNSYSGDNMMFGGDGLYGLNAGEVVLTKAQQSNLANSLEGGLMRTIHVIGKISGNDILLSADRSLRLQGKELAVWGRG